MHDLGAIVWVVVVIAGVVSSMVKSAQKANAQRNVDAATVLKIAAGPSGVRPTVPPEPMQAMSQRYLAQRALLQGASAPQPAAQQPQPAAWAPTPAYAPGGVAPVWTSSLGPTVAAPAPPPLSTLAAPAPTIVQRKPVPKAAPKPTQVQRPTIEPWHQEPTRQAGYRGFLFEEKSSIVRGIIAAEVLGAPLALREGTFWSQQHSGRSI